MKFVVRKSLIQILILLLSYFQVQSINDTIPYSSIYDDKASSLVYGKLHKCHCSINEVWSNGVCQGNDTLITALIDEYSSTTQIIETNTIEEVFVAELNCPQNYLNLTLPGESFALKTSGELFNVNYGLNLEFDKYCISHKVDGMNEIYTEVHLCLPIPTVPRCCPDHLYDSLTKECNIANNTNIDISFMLGKRNFQMSTKSFPNVLKCQESENRTHIAVGGDTAQLKLTNEGLILAHQISLVGDMIYIPSPEYCVEVDGVGNEVTSASYCYTDPLSAHMDICSDSTCIRKCCSPNEVFDMNNFKCVSVIKSKRWSPEFYDSTSLEREMDPPRFKMVTGFPLSCEFFTLSPNNDPPDDFKLLSNGSLYVEAWELSVLSYQYCVDNFKYGNEVLQESLVCFLDRPKASAECERVETILYPILLIISCIFLAVTLIVYAIIPDLHAKVQGKCLIASVSSLLGAYICLTCIQLMSNKLTEGLCITFGLLTQFSLLASFFWLNVMSFDIWRTLRSMKTGRESPAGARRRYLLYSLYAWGCPFVIVMVTLTMQFLPEALDRRNLILPRFGESICFFPVYARWAQWLYFYGFIAAILVANSFLFAHLAYTLFRARKISESALGKKTQLHKEWAKLYLKLFLIMGITWIFELASWIEGSCGYWVLTDIINSLRGLLIFIIFVCKRDVIKKLMSESTPAFHRMRTTVRQSSFFSRSSKRTSNLYIDPTTVSGANEISSANHHADTSL